LTYREWIELKATLHAIDNREFICGECKSRYRGRQDEAEMTEKSRQIKGCYGIAERVLHHINREIFFSQCVGNFFNFAAIGFLEMHHQYERGIMPYPGSLSDQPSKIIEIFRIIDAHKRDKIKQEQAQEQLRRTRG
jgi:hypothetical protein